MRTISQEIPQPSIIQISSKIIYLKCHPNFSRANELMMLMCAITRTTCKVHQFSLKAFFTPEQMWVNFYKPSLFWKTFWHEIFNVWLLWYLCGSSAVLQSCPQISQQSDSTKLHHSIYQFQSIFLIWVFISKFISMVTQTTFDDDPTSAVLQPHHPVTWTGSKVKFQVLICITTKHHMVW